MKVYGYTIEMIFKDHRTSWENHFNHKVYMSEFAAIEAITQIKKDRWYNKIEFRIVPLYTIDDREFPPIS